MVRIKIEIKFMSRIEVKRGPAKVPTNARNARSLFGAIMLLEYWVLPSNL